MHIISLWKFMELKRLKYENRDLPIFLSITSLLPESIGKARILPPSHFWISLSQFWKCSNNSSTGIRNKASWQKYENFTIKHHNCRDSDSYINHSATVNLSSQNQTNCKGTSIDVYTSKLMTNFTEFLERSRQVYYGINPQAIWSSMMITWHAPLEPRKYIKLLP